VSAPHRYDCIVIGGGHNGLVCAAYLARAGRSVLLLEAAPQVGGAALTREFAPGFRVSACAHLLHLMPETLIRELALERHGLSMAAEHLPTTALSPEGAPLRLDPRNPAALAAHSPADARAYARLDARLNRMARALKAVLERVPPRLGAGSMSDRLAWLSLGWRLRSLGRADLRELLRIGALCVQDLLDEQFETPLLKGALAFDAVLGTNAGPRSPGSVFTLLYRMAAAGERALAQPRGGLGALTGALARSAIAAGAVIRTSAAVERILVEADRACGVQLESGETLTAGCVVSSADPKTTFLRLLGAEHLDTGFVRRIVHLRGQGLTAKLHLALDRPPAFRGVDAAALAGRLLLAPSLEYIERAFNHSKYAEYSSSPILEITVPTLADPALASQGSHVLSAVVQYVPYKLAAGWAGERERLIERVVAMLDECAPGLASSVRASELLTPADIEREFRLSGGHWHHAELSLDQFFLVRPVPGFAQYRSPLERLYLCGAGCHPGGGVMGIAGRNAAQQVMREAA